MFKYSHQYPHGIEIISDSCLKKNIICYDIDIFYNVYKTVKHFIEHECSDVVPVYDISFEGDRRIIHYSYTMKRLCVLSSEEKTLIDACFKIYSGPIDLTDQRVIEGKENYPALFELCNRMITDNIYWDRHSGNILKDEVGDYKIIDLEGFNPFDSWDRTLT